MLNRLRKAFKSQFHVCRTCQMNSSADQNNFLNYCHLEQPPTSDEMPQSKTGRLTFSGTSIRLKHVIYG